MRSVSTVALAVGLSFVGATASDAATVGFSRAANLGEDLTGPSLAFDRFDPALGTLTGVTFTLDVESVATDASVSASFSSGEGGSASTKVRSEFVVYTSADLLEIFFGTGSAMSSCTAPSGSGCANPSADPGSVVIPTFPTTVTITDPANFGEFIVDAFSTQFGVYAGVRALSELETCVEGFGGSGSCTHTALVSWAGSVSVAFSFEPKVDPVPAPATLGLLGAGMIGLAAARRRRA